MQVQKFRFAIGCFLLVVASAFLLTESRWGGLATLVAVFAHLVFGIMDRREGLTSANGTAPREQLVEK